LRRRARAAVAVLLAASLGGRAAAYLPPGTAILKRVAQRRDDLALASMQVQGTLALAGEAAARAAAAGVVAGAESVVPAFLLVKTPGRCRLELAPAGVATSERPAVTLRASRVAGHHGLEGVPAAVALVEAVCALLAERGGGSEPEHGLAQALVGRGVALGDVTLGRLSGRVAWIIGGRPQDGHPQAWVDKQSFQPVRLIADFGAGVQDVRLLDFGSPIGGDGFPRAVEVWSGAQLQARFTTERLTPNPKLPDAVF